MRQDCLTIPPHYKLTVYMAQEPPMYEYSSPRNNHYARLSSSLSRKDRTELSARLAKEVDHFVANKGIIVQLEPAQTKDTRRYSRRRVYNPML